MPKDPRIKKVLVIGSGPIIIGQAAEFDYSGTQACRALKAEGIETVLLNSNPATIMTDPDVADHVYIEPMTLEVVERILDIEKPDSVLPNLGGQMGLNLSMELARSGYLDRTGIRLLACKPETIDRAEDRELFKETMEKLHQPIIPSEVVETLEDALACADRIGYPVIVRPAFTMGGTGGGICENKAKLIEIGTNGLRLSPIHQILVEKCIAGWKEIEYEVMRDHKGNVITVCNMENLDPVGIHTGDSVVVAPSQTLTDHEYQMLRTAALDIITELGIEGGCNCQFALKPDSFDYAVIEVNPRVSRSSALASKATGFPLAFVAAKIALGYTLDQIGEMGTPNSAYEAPQLDYLICKIPRWDLTKFAGVSRQIGSSMKSVGEIMSIGRSFEEIIQKGLRMIGQGMHGFVGNDHTKFENLDEELANPTDLRIFSIASALEEGYSIERIHELTKIDPWFLGKLKNIVDYKAKLSTYNKIEDLPADVLRQAKVLGFSDFQIARFVLKASGNMEKENLAVRARRKALNILPAVKRINTVASEHPELTNYLYMTYATTGYDVNYYKNEKSVVVLGSGAYRIGSSVEFDWCSVNAIQTARKLGYNGFLDFRVALASGSSSIESLKSDPIRPTDNDEAVIEKMFLASMRAMEDTLKALPKNKLSTLAEKAVRAKRIFVFGTASSEFLATSSTTWATTPQRYPIPW